MKIIEAVFWFYINIIAKIFCQEKFDNAGPYILIPMLIIPFLLTAITCIMGVIICFGLLGVICSILF